MPLPLMRACVSVAGISSDNCRGVALDVLRTAVVAGPECVRVVATCGGIDCLFDAVIDPSCKRVAMPTLFSLLYVMNAPELRKFVRPRFAVQRLLSAFTADIRTHRDELWGCEVVF